MVVVWQVGGYYEEHLKSSRNDKQSIAETEPSLLVDVDISIASKIL